MHSFVVHQPFPVDQNTIYVLGVFLSAAGPDMAGSPLPAMINVLAAAGAVSSARIATQRRRRASALRW